MPVSPLAHVSPALRGAHDGRTGGALQLPEPDIGRAALKTTRARPGPARVSE